jgi:beta-glucanase (GH16 family)
MLYKILLLGVAWLFTACGAHARDKKDGHEKQADTSRSFESRPYWHDEFNKDGLPDTGKWGYDVGGHGWGNNELEFYTNGKNAFVRNGKLVIEARKEEADDNNYTSARLVTKGKAAFLYGRFEIKAKLPPGKGLWPAIWLLSEDDAYGRWPRSGEIDIMEQVGYDPDNIHVTVHTEAYNHIKGTQKTAIWPVPTATTAFHVYRVDWMPGIIRGFIDDTQVFSFTNDGAGAAYWPFDKKFYLLLNLAVGGNWGGAHGIDKNAFPARMEIDYVRVYRMKEK